MHVLRENGVRRRTGRQGADAEQNLAEENLAEENLAEENLAEENLAEENLAEKNLAGENLAEENLADENLAEENQAHLALLQVRRRLIRVRVGVSMGEGWASIMAAKPYVDADVC